MKYIFILLFNTIVVTSNSQITIPVTNLPSIGDTFVYIIDSNSAIAVPSNSVSNFNFSTLKNHGESVFIYKANDDLSTYPNSNLKLEIDANISNSAYFKKTTNDLLIYGMSGLGAGGGGLPVPVPSLNGTLKYVSFPLNSTSNSTSSDKISLGLPADILGGALNIDSMIKVLLVSINPAMDAATVHVDSIIIGVNLTNTIKTIGFGKITTPIDTNIDVLRIERALKTSISASIKGNAKLGPITFPLNNDITPLLAGQIPGGSPNMTIKSHLYYSNITKQELFSADIDSTTNTYMNILYRFKSAKSSGGGGGGGGSVSISNTSKTDVSILVQEDNIKVNTESFKPLDYTIFSLQGQKILYGNIENKIIDISKLTKGVYILNIDQNGFLKTFKFNK